jgi:hypothetical protein
MLDYHIDPARNLIVTRAMGKITASELSTYFVRLMRDPVFQPELNALIIAVDVNAVPTANEVTLLAPLIRAWSKRRAGVKWAFVLPNQASRDFAESMLAQARLTAVTSRCFLSEAAAAAWLEPAGGTAVRTTVNSAPKATDRRG